MTGSAFGAGGNFGSQFSSGGSPLFSNVFGMTANAIPFAGSGGRLQEAPTKLGYDPIADVFMVGASAPESTERMLVQGNVSGQSVLRVKTVSPARIAVSATAANNGGLGIAGRFQSAATAEPALLAIGDAYYAFTGMMLADLGSDAANADAVAINSQSNYGTSGYFAQGDETASAIPTRNVVYPALYASRVWQGGIGARDFTSAVLRVDDGLETATGPVMDARYQNATLGDWVTIFKLIKTGNGRLTLGADNATGASNDGTYFVADAKGAGNSVYAGFRAQNPGADASLIAMYSNNYSGNIGTTNAIARARAAVWETDGARMMLGTAAAAAVYFFTGNEPRFFLDSSGHINVYDGYNFIFGTAGAGTKFGTGSTQKMGWWGATPVVRHATAFTQTYATVSHTNANPVATAPADTNGVVGFAAAGDRTAVVTAVGNLVTDVANIKQFVNAIVDALQSYGLIT